MLPAFSSSHDRRSGGKVPSGGRDVGAWRAFGRWLCLGLLACAAWTSHAAEVPLRETQLKSAWLLNFARFVEWPESSFTASNSPLIVTVIGDDPLGPDLEKIFEGQRVKDHPILIRRATLDDELNGCQIAYLGSVDRRRMRTWLERLKGRPILTVGEGDDFLSSGGMIEFSRHEKSIRFSVNLTVAQGAKLRVSAKLLKVAASVQYEKGKE